jgi:hypothetical protein
MVNSNSLTTIKTFPLSKRIQRILPVIEIYTIDDTLFVYTTKIDEPVEVTYSPEEPNITFRSLREAFVASGKFTDEEERRWAQLEKEEKVKAGKGKVNNS